MEDDSNAMEGKMWGEPGEPVPAVDVADMKALLAVMQGPSSQGEGLVAICGAQAVCSPGADTRAIWYRLIMLNLIEDLFKAAYPGGRLSEGALKAVSTMELTWIPVRVPQEQFPFDLTRFLVQVKAEAA